MNEFLRRIEPMAAPEIPIAASRPAPMVAPVAATTGTGSATEKAGEPAVAAADYAKLRTDIRSVIDGMATGGGVPSAAELDSAENALLALMPQPAVVLPLPPADADMRAFVAQVTQSVARQAAQTRAAQGNALPAVVDAATGG